MTMEINAQEDLAAVSEQVTKLVEEVNKISATRENLIQQVQNLNGISMYLRGKLPPEEQAIPAGMEILPESDDLDRSIEYPTEE